MTDYGFLLEEAKKAREYSYSPYSHFAVGAALLTETGKIYTGCNVENSSYGVSNCAERTALFKAVSEGEKEFSAIAVVGAKVLSDGSKEEVFCPPCGVCRQALSEFCSNDLSVIIGKEDGTYMVTTLKELLPLKFGL
ncbi:MAG: cytidine deaminase [Lachnospiraceae bacterium]|nr:cytidine deaminase [Lachnospiraceae bacterium]